MITIYRGLMSWADSIEGIVFDTPIDRDRMSVQGVPEKLFMLDGWRIRPDDEQYLQDGFLVYQVKSKIVVSMTWHLQQAF